MNPNASSPANAKMDDKLAADALCDRFEQAWQDGSKPDLASWVPAPGTMEGALRSAVLPELALLDMEYRFRAGEAVSSEHYVNLYPELGGAAIAGRLRAAEDRLRRLATQARGSSTQVPQTLADPTWKNGSAAFDADTGVNEGARPKKADFDLSRILAPPQRPGELGRLGQYRVLEVLGKGGMGMVLLAEDTQLQRQAALKIMLPQHADDAEACERFLREARAAASLKHDNIVTIFQVGAERGLPFIALEHLQGSPLDRYLKENGEVSVAQAVRIGCEIAEGLHAAHVRGLVHRDIKPGNIWLESRDGGGTMTDEKVHAPLTFRVKILDFGLARPELDDTHLTQSGAIVGTPAFMSPEQARGDAVDGRSDLWSLGVVLYRLCTGKQPFSGNNTLALLTSLALETPIAVRQLNPNVPVELEQLINRLLAKKRDERPGSAREVVKALSAMDAAVQAVPILAKSTVNIGGSLGAVTTNVLAPRQSPDGRSRGMTVAKWMTLAITPFLAVFGGWYIFHISHSDGTVPAQKLPDGAKGDPIDPKGGKVTIAPPGEPKVDHDRKAVEMLRPHVQRFFIRLLGNGREAWITPGDALPEVPFVLKAIRFAPRSPKLPVDFTPRVFLPAVLPLGSLESIGFYDVRIFMSEDELAKFAEAPCAGKINNLGLHFELNPRNIETLKRFPKLESLHCDAATASDADVARLTELPLLNKLWLGWLGKSGGVTRKSYETIASLPLKALGLQPGSPTLDGEALALLATMPHLKDIRLDGSGITDKTLPDFSKLKQLQIIGLFGSNVTDDGLMKLAKSKSLRQLLTRAGKKNKFVTEAGAKRLSEALPACQILLPGGVKIGPKDKSVPPLPPDDDPDDDDDPDRAAAEMLHPYIAIGIRMRDGSERTIGKKGKIPSEPFTVAIIGAPPAGFGGPFPDDFHSKFLLPAALELSALEVFNSVVLRPWRLYEEDISRLAEAPFAPKLRALGGNFELTHKNLDALKSFTMLTRLECRIEEADDAVLSRLRELPRLDTLSLCGKMKSAALTGRGLESIASLPLKSLWFKNKPLTAEALKKFAAMPELTSFGVVVKGGPKDKLGFEALQKYGDQLMPEISKFPKLERLIFTEHRGISDAAVPHLQEMKSLRLLLLKRTSVTEAGAKKLCDSLPKCEITYGENIKIGPKDKSVPPLPPDGDPDEAADPDRKAVEMLRPHVTSFVIRLVDNGKELTLTPAGPIPDESFVVKKIQFGGSPKLPDDFTARIFLPAVLPLGSLESVWPNNPMPRLHLSDDELATWASAPCAGTLIELGAIFELSQKSIDSLKRFPKLARIRCKANLAGDAELERLKELPSLQQLRLENLGNSRKLTRKGCEAIASLPLTSLRLNPGSPFFDTRNVMVFASMPNLIYFQLQGPHITDNRLPDFSKFQGLLSLSLLKTSVTDDGLMSLAAIKSLQKLELVGTDSVTVAGAKRLSDALPKCVIRLGSGKKIGPKDKSVPPLPPDDEPDEAAEPDEPQGVARMMVPRRQGFVRL